MLEGRALTRNGERGKLTIWLVKYAQERIGDVSSGQEAPLRRESGRGAIPSIRIRGPATARGRDTRHYPACGGTHLCRSGSRGGAHGSHCRGRRGQQGTALLLLQGQGRPLPGGAGKSLDGVPAVRSGRAGKQGLGAREAAALREPALRFHQRAAVLSALGASADVQRQSRDAPRGSRI